MPADFDACRAAGGKIRTINPEPGKYLHVCYDAQGHAHSGEVKSKQKGRQQKSKKKY